MASASGGLGAEPPAGVQRAEPPVGGQWGEPPAEAECLFVFACPKEAVNLPHYWYLQKSVNHTVNEWMISGFVEKWTLKWKCSETSFRINRRDTELRFVTKFGENLPLRSCRNVAWFTKQKKLGLRGTRPSPHFGQMGRSRPKFPDRCHPLTCPRTPNLVRIGCAVPDLFRKDWFFGPKSNYNIGVQPTIKCSEIL